ncbi:MAG TPA: DUF1338 domain-containing protein [Ramlibacter sp.]|nr:DUF1338 domain-containing protein [Ramlibacter sp. WS9]HSV36714.1 DUF1338 domain-containing protein [Ramlibacter sp.]
MSNIEKLLVDLQGADWTWKAFDRIAVKPPLLGPQSESVTQAELAQALNMLLFADLIERVPAGRAYVEDVIHSGGKVHFDHGALRTVRWPTGALPRGEEAITRVLRALGYRHNGTYPLERLKMTGRSWAHAEFPEEIAQFFVSELHPERFSASFQLAVSRVIGASRDPLTPQHAGLLEQLARDQSLSHAEALILLPAMQACFARHHGVFPLCDYELLLAESAEMAWIATEGNAFNHATDRVEDVEAVAVAQRRLGRPIKDVVEVSKSGRVRQTAFRAALVDREFTDEQGRVVRRSVPGSFYEFISRGHVDEAGGEKTLDLQFDAGNATAIFGMTTASPVLA